MLILYTHHEHIIQLRWMGMPQYWTTSHFHLNVAAGEKKHQQKLLKCVLSDISMSSSDFMPSHPTDSGTDVSTAMLLA